MDLDQGSIPLLPQVESDERSERLLEAQGKLDTLLFPSG